MHSYMHAFIHAYTQTYRQTDRLTYIHTQPCIHTYTQTEREITVGKMSYVVASTSVPDRVRP